MLRSSGKHHEQHAPRRTRTTKVYNVVSLWLGGSLPAPLLKTTVRLPLASSYRDTTTTTTLDIGPCRTDVFVENATAV